MKEISKTNIVSCHIILKINLDRTNLNISKTLATAHKQRAVSITGISQ